MHYVLERGLFLLSNLYNYNNQEHFSQQSYQIVLFSIVNEAYFDKKTKSM